MHDAPGLDGVVLFANDLPVRDDGAGAVDRDPGVGAQVEAVATPSAAQEVGVEDDLSRVVQVVSHDDLGRRDQVVRRGSPQRVAVWKSHEGTVPGGGRSRDPTAVHFVLRRPPPTSIGRRPLPSAAVRSPLTPFGATH